jgi:tetratricopeptide (TPR) repeat protein
VLSLGPVLGLLDMSFMQFSFVSDHLDYLAVPVVTATAAAIVATLARRSAAWRTGAVALGAAAIIVLGLATAARAQLFAMNKTLWADTAAKNPTAWIAFDWLGVIAEHEQNDPQAVRDYDQAIRYSPPGHAVRYRYRQGSAYFRMNRLDQAREVLQGCAWDAADDHSDRQLARQLLAEVLRRLGQYDQARQQYELLLAEPDIKLPGMRAMALNNLADLLTEKLDQPQAALPYARTAVVLAPNQPDYRDTLGWTYFRAGQADLAEKTLKSAILMRPTPTYRYHLGMVLEARGQKQEALSQYQLALEAHGLDANDPSLALIKERLEALQGKPM